MATAPTTTAPSTNDVRRLGRARYAILAWLLLAGVLNYMDRASVSIAAPHMISELHVTKTDIGLLGTVFSWTYAFCQLPAGWLIDKFGAKRLYFVAVSVWSVATALMSLGQNMTHFIFFRFLLGVGESPNSPNCSKITTQWFPRQERGQAAGIWDSGSKWGSAIAPPVLTALALGFGWRAMFVVVGLLGLLLAGAFIAFYRAPEDSKHLSEEEYRYILEGRDRDEVKQEKIPWLSFFAHPQTWGLSLGFFTSIWIWNIFITFLPLYMQSTLHITIAKTGIWAALPYLAAAIVGMFGGRLSLLLARHGLSPLRSKKRVLVACSLITGILLCLVPFVNGLLSAEIVLCCALAMIAIIQSQSWALSSDIVPDAYAARFGGIMNFVGYFGGALAPVLTGYIADKTGSYSPSFFLAGAIAACGALFYGLLIKRPISRNLVEERA